MVSPPLSPCPPQAGSWCSRLERRPYVRLIVLGNEPRHANGLGPRIPKLPSEFDLCTNESHPLTRSSPCEAPSTTLEERRNFGCASRNPYATVAASGRSRRLPLRLVGDGAPPPQDPAQDGWRLTLSRFVNRSGGGNI